MVSVRRIEPGDAALLRTVRLAALEDAPSAFGSTHAAEAVRSDHEWAERALAGSKGSARATFFANEPLWSSVSSAATETVRQMGEWSSSQCGSRRCTGGAELVAHSSTR